MYKRQEYFLSYNLKWRRSIWLEHSDLFQVSELMTVLVHGMREVKFNARDHEPFPQLWVHFRLTAFIRSPIDIEDIRVFLKIGNQLVFTSYRILTHKNIGKLFLKVCFHAVLGLAYVYLICLLIFIGGFHCDFVPQTAAICGSWRKSVGIRRHDRAPNSVPACLCLFH